MEGNQPSELPALKNMRSSNLLWLTLKMEHIRAMCLHQTLLERKTRPFKGQTAAETFKTITVPCLLMWTVKSPQLVSYACACFLGCQCPVGLSNGKAKVCYYSGWYYCQNCHQDNSFLIPARLLHNWDTNKHKVSKCSPDPLFNLGEGPDLVVYTDLCS